MPREIFGCPVRGSACGDPLLPIRPQGGIVAALALVKVLMGTVFNDAPLVDHQDAVGLSCSGQAVGNGEGGAAGNQGA